MYAVCVQHARHAVLLPAIAVTSILLQGCDHAGCLGTSLACAQPCSGLGVGEATIMVTYGCILAYMARVECPIEGCFEIGVDQKFDRKWDYGNSGGVVTYTH